MRYIHISQIYRLMGGDGVLTDGASGSFNTDFPVDMDGLLGENHLARKALALKSIKQYDPLEHDVTKTSLRPNKKVFKPTGDKDPVTGEDKLQLDFEPVARIPLRIQRYIIQQKASFARGNGVKLKPSDVDSEVFKWVYNNWYKNKTDYDLRDIFEKFKSETQCAVVFFADDEALTKARNSVDATKLRLRHKLWYPSKGSYLYPYFDPETETLVALVREYENTDGETVYDVYLAPDPANGRLRPVLRRIQKGQKNSFTQIELPYPKLPIIYWGQDYIELEDSKALIDEMENSFSDFCEQQKYTGDPLLFGKGKTLNMPAKGTAGKFIEGSEDADLKFVTPDNATESRELHFEMIQKWIFSLNRAVVMDLDTMKDLNEVSGAALDRLLVDVYTEATDHQTGYWGKGVQRMVNFQVALAKDILGLEDDETTVDVEITKYRINDLRETVEVLTLANGNLPLLDHEQSIIEAGLADDPAVSYERLQAQQEAANKQPVQNQQAQQRAAQQPPRAGDGDEPGIIM